ncbi:hypothetical protein F3J17_04235 [Burkholderia sp. Ax-1719]|nr:hypothetical protein [Burkholderia sp. Ax-1719]
MNIRSLSVAVALVTASVGTAFASGLGPAPFYRPDVSDARISQSAVAKENTPQQSDTSYGGAVNAMQAGQNQSAPSATVLLYRHH